MNKYIDNQGGNYTLLRENRWLIGIKFLLDILKTTNDRNIHILDVGCGDGSFYKFFKLYAKNRGIDISNITYFGVDYNPKYQKYVNKLKGIYICCNVLELSKTIKKRFDFIIASEIIEHIDETDVLLKEISRVLKSDGYIYLTTPNLAAWHCRIMLLFGYQPFPTEVSNIDSTFGKGFLGKKYYGTGPIHHIRLFTFKALKEFVQYHGLEIVKSMGGGYRKVELLLFRNHFIDLAPLIILILKKKNKLYEKN